MKAHQKTEKQTRGLEITNVVGIAMLAATLCWASSRAAADIITVGAHGQERTVADAIATAVSTSSPDQIRIEGPAVYVENLSVVLNSSTGELSISGGWDPTFTVRTDDPFLTVIDGDHLDRVIDFRLTDGNSLSISNLTLRNGTADLGGGMNVTAYEGSEVFVYGLAFVNNEAVSTPADGAEGGGLRMSLNGAYGEVDDNLFSGNKVRVPTSDNTLPVAGGAAAFSVMGGTNPDLEFAGNWLTDNGCERQEQVGTAEGCAVSITLSHPDGSVTVSRNTVLDTFARGFSQVNATAARISISNQGSAELENNRWLGTDYQDVGLAVALVQVVLNNGAEANQRSSVFNGNADSVLYVSPEDAVWNGVNLTVAGRGDYGIGINGHSSTINLSNSISTGHSVEDLWVSSSQSLGQDSNLIGGDPGFVNLAGGYLQLRQGSPAVDAGTMTPAGGLSHFDADREPRVEGPSVDIGAYEGTDMIFADGFSTGGLEGWQ